MEILNNGYTLRICEGGFPLSTDSMVLAHFAALGRNCRVLDLGSGCGTLGLLLCAKDPLCHVTGVELEEHAHNAALQNIARNGLSQRMDSIHGDLRGIKGLVGAGSDALQAAREKTSKAASKRDRKRVCLHMSGSLPRRKFPC